MRRTAGLLVAALLLATSARAQGRLVTDTVRSAGLARNVVGDGAARRVLVYLPPSYDLDPHRRFPVLYLLHGVTSLPDEWFQGIYQGLDLKASLDSLMTARAIPEFLVVLPDANDTLQADWYEDSPTLGRWERFIAQDLVRAIDRRYRTEARAERRAIAGHSMGGLGALNIAFDHPDRFAYVYASSPCCIGFYGRIGPDNPAWALLTSLKRWQDAPPRARLALGMAAAFDGAPKDPRLFKELPFTVDSAGNVVPHPDAQRRWLERMPPARARAMARHGKRRPAIAFDWGTEEPDVGAGAAMLSQVLDSLHLPYHAASFAGGHVDHVRERFVTAMLPTVGRWFAPSIPGTDR